MGLCEWGEIYYFIVGQLEMKFDFGLSRILMVWPFSCVVKLNLLVF